MSLSFKRFRGRSGRSFAPLHPTPSSAWVIPALCLACPALVSAATLTWTGAAGTGTISTAGNWATGTAPVSGDILVFDGNTALGPQLTANLTVGQLNFATTAGSFVLGGAGQYTINASGIVNNSSQTQTINNQLLLGAAQKWAATSGGLVFGGTLATNAKTLTIDGGFNTTLSGAISGTGKITKIGTGTLTLAGTNTHSGITTLTAGTLAVANNNALGTAALYLATATLRAEGGARTLANAIRFTGNSTLGGTDSLTFTGLVNQSANRTVTLGGSALTTFSGGLALSTSATARVLTLAGTGDLLVNSAITNGSTATTGSIIKTGTGTLTFSGSAANTYAGTTTVNAGTLLLAKTGVNAITGNLVVGDTSGSDVVRLLGSHQIGDNSAVTVNSAGLLDFDDFSDTIGSLAGAGKVDLGSGTLTAGGLNTSTTFSGQFLGTGGLVKTGTGTLTLSGNANSLPILNITGGTVALGAAGAVSGATAVTITGGTLSGGSQNNTLGALTLTGGSVLTTTGTLTLAGGVTATSAGAAASTIGGKLALGTGADFHVVSGGAAASDLAIGAVISGTGSALTKSGNGVLLLSGANTYTGTTWVNAGTLRLAGGAAIADTSQVTLAAAGGAVLDLDGSAETIGALAGGGQVLLGSGTLATGAANTSTTFAGAISGSGGLTKTGSGVFTLTGSNSYSGTTTVSGGILRAGGPSSLAGSSAFVLANVAGAALDLADTSATIGSLAGGGESGGNVLLGRGTLTLGGNHGSTTFAGNISGTSGNLVKTGTGTLVLTAGQSLTGAVSIEAGTLALAGSGGNFSANSSFTLRAGGTLLLDNSTQVNPDRVSAATVLNLDGGTLSFVSGPAGSSESLGSFNLLSGASRVELTHNGTATDATVLSFGSLGTLAPGATVSFNAGQGILGAAATGPQVYIAGTAPGFIGGWATVGSDFAEYSTYGVRAITGYYTGADGINVNDPGQIPILTSTSAAGASTLTRAGTTTDKALNLADIATVSLGSDASRTLNLASGGLVKSTTTATTLSGLGRLTAGDTGAGNLAITVGSGSSLTVASSIIDNAGTDGIYGNANDGVVSLSKAGTGTLTLSGINTYSGGNFLNDGVVSISAEGNLGAAANGITFNGGTLRVSSGFTTSGEKTLTVAAGLSGSLEIAGGQSLTLANTAGRLVSGNAASSLFLTGGGNLVLQAANAGYTGAVHVQAGTLELRAAQANAGTTSLGGGTLRLRNDSSTAFTSQLAVVATSTIDVDRLSGTGAAVGHSLGAVTMGPATLTVTGGNGSSLALGATTLTGNATFNPTLASLSLGAVSGSFGFTKTGAAALTLTAASSHTGATTIQAGTLRLGAANASSAASALSLAAGTTFDLANFSTGIGSLAGSGAVTLGSGTLTAGGNDASTTFSGTISGTGGLTKTGGGVLTLGGSNTYSGATSVTRGTLQLGAADRISDVSPVTLSAGASLALGGFNETIGSLAGNGGVDLGGGTLTAGGNGATTAYAGTISGTGQFRKDGTGTLTLSGDSNFTGAAVIAGGTVNVRSATAFGTSAGGVTVGAGAALELQDNVRVDLEALTLQGAGAGGTGALRSLGGANSWTGNLSLAAASTIATDAGSLALTGTIAGGANLLTFSGAGITNVSGAVSGSAGMVKSGTGSLVLGGSSGFTGTFQITGGIAVVSHGSALGAAGSNNGTHVTAGTTLQIDHDSGLTVSGEILTLNGAGISGTGALASTSGINTWTGAVTLATDAAVGVHDDSLSLSGVISGAGRSLTKVGVGDLNLSAAHTFSGATLVTEGTLNLTAGSLASTSITVNSGAGLAATGALAAGTSLTANGVVRFNGGSRALTSLAGNASGSLVLDGASLDIAGGTFAGTLTDGTTSGSLSKSGAATLTLGGAGSYSGTTRVLGGTLVINGDQSAATGDVTVSNGATLAGAGTLGGATALASGATHAPVGSQTFASTVSYNSGSIFAWDLAITADLGATNSGAYDKVAARAVAGSDAVFQILLNPSNSFDDAFWNTSRTWTNVFTAQSAVALASIFSRGFGGSVPVSGIVGDRGQFSFSGNNLQWSTWSAVPEPGSALGGLLLAAGLLRRRRPAERP